MTPENCPSCGSNEKSPILDLGTQPICNRFLQSPTVDETLFPFGISLCGHCGLVTFTHNIPVAELRPRFDWITYREAEAHLDDAVDQIITASGASEGQASVLGVSFQDAPTIERFRARKFENAGILDMGRDLGITNACSGVETIQSAVTAEWAGEYVGKHKPADIVVARYILEHAHDIGSFLAAVRTLVKPGGCVAIEVPDFTTALLNFEYSNLFEEHNFYFTPATVQWLLKRHGFTITRMLSYPYSLENSMVVICRPGEPDGAGLPADEHRGEISRAEAFAAEFPRRRAQIHASLARLRQEGKIAIFGAGHIAAKFINLLGLSEFISFVVDDHPKKCGMYMPGSRLPIKPSASLAGEGVKWCLLTLNPDSENKVMKNLKPVFDSGGITAYSVFRASSITLPLDS